jgi:hypothetical protein
VSAAGAWEELLVLLVLAAFCAFCFVRVYDAGCPVARNYCDSATGDSMRSTARGLMDRPGCGSRCYGLIINSGGRSL